MKNIAPCLNLHPDFVMPVYGRRSIAEVPATVRYLLGCEPTVPTLPKSWFPSSERARMVILLIVDGLGYEQCATLSCFDHFRKRGSCHAITSTFPSTTPVALTALLTGGTATSLGLGDYNQYLPPSEFPDGKGRMGKIIPYTTAGNSLADVGFREEHIFDGRTLFEQLGDRGSYVVSPYVSGAYANRIHAGASGRFAYSYALESMAHVRNAVTAPNHPFLVVGYYPDADKVGHAHGPNSPEQLSVINGFTEALTNGVFARITPEQARGVSIIITADHGQMVVEQDKLTYLDTPEFGWLEDRLQDNGAGGKVPLVTWSRRCPALYIRPELVDDSVAKLRSQLCGKASVARVTDVLATGLYGPPDNVSPRFLGRAGTILILPHPGHCVWVSTDKERKGTHGGLSASEMQVPFFYAPLADLVR